MRTHLEDFNLDDIWDQLFSNEFVLKKLFYNLYLIIFNLVVCVMFSLKLGFGDLDTPGPFVSFFCAIECQCEHMLHNFLHSQPTITGKRVAPVRDVDMSNCHRTKLHREVKQICINNCHFLAMYCPKFNFLRKLIYILNAHKGVFNSPKKNDY